MHTWAAFLAQTPPTLQRLIASSQRISLPRRCSPEERLARLRAAICRAAAVRSVYFWLNPDEQQAVQILRAIPRGLNAADLAARFGPIRPLSELRADRAPRSISERLLLLGWLLPRPATQNHPLRYLLPPELRAWLPVPLTSRQPATGNGQPDAHGVPAYAPALRAATAMLVCAAATPLPLRRDGRLTAAALRELTPRLAPLPSDDVAALYDWLWPLLGDLGLLAPHGAAVVVAPAARRFLATSPAERLELLTDAWLRAPRADRWLTALRVNRRGLDWPAFRRRLCAWAAVVPPDLPPAAAATYDRLAAALGPLGDATTHGLTFPRRRLPWAQRNAAQVWAAACAGPLRWLGKLPQRCGDDGRPTTDDGRPTIDNRPPMTDDLYSAGAGRWSVVSSDVSAAAASTLIHVPPLTGEADLLTLAPFAATVCSAADGDAYTLTRASVASAVARGYDAARLRAVLVQQCGAISADLAAILTPNGGLRMTAQTVLLSDQPADLDAALRRRSVRRAVSDQLAPGVALVAPGGEAALARALARDGRVVTPPPPVETPPVSELTPGEMAALLVAAAHYQAHAPADAPPGPGAPLLARLRAGLPPALQAATDATIATLRRTAEAVAGNNIPVDSMIPSATASASQLAELHEQTTLPAVSNMASATASARAQHPMNPAPGSGDAGQQPLPGGWQAAAGDWVVGGRPACPEAVAGSVVASHSPVAATAPCPALADLRDQLEAAMRRRNAVTLTYQGADETAPRERIVRPLRLERHGPWWYLYAYCLQARAERCFRLDRVHGLADAAAEKPQKYHWRSSVRPAEPAPALSRPPQRSRIVRTGFFPDPPDPAPGHPLVGVWLE
jgi:hypothetical protein